MGKLEFVFYLRFCGLNALFFATMHSSSKEVWRDLIFGYSKKRFNFEIFRIKHSLFTAFSPPRKGIKRGVHLTVLEKALHLQLSGLGDHFLRRFSPPIKRSNRKLHLEIIEKDFNICF